MSGTTWAKWFWSDWLSDPAVRLCSYAARGLWMDMLAIAAGHEPVGYVAVSGRPLDATALARMTGGAASEVEELLAELERNGVFSRTGKGVIYSRRMISDAKKAKTASENGKKGGYPTHGKNTGNSGLVNPQLVETAVAKSKPHKPEARSQKESEDANASLSPKGDDGPKPPIAKAYPAAFEEAWRAYPHVKGRSSKPDALEVWRRLPAAEREGLVDAINSFRPNCDRVTGGRGAADMAVWLKHGKHLNWMMEEAPAPAARPVTPEVTAQRVRHFRDTGEWREAWGPIPEGAAA